MDLLTPEKRSANMAAIRSNDTRPELFVRKLLFCNGYRYRLYSEIVPGHPDIWLRKYNVAIFINGCFWHRHRDCKYSYTPKSRLDFWNKKFEQNIRRDMFVRQQLMEKNIRCLIIWECTIKAMKRKNANPEDLLRNIESFLNSDSSYMEL